MTTYLLPDARGHMIQLRCYLCLEVSQNNQVGIRIEIWRKSAGLRDSNTTDRYINENERHRRIVHFLVSDVFLSLFVLFLVNATQPDPSFSIAVLRSQNIVFSQFAALYLPGLLDKWKQTPDIYQYSAYFYIC
jgi:hypothetical protein